VRDFPGRQLGFGVVVIEEPGRVSWDHAEYLSAVNQTNEAGL